MTEYKMKSSIIDVPRQPSQADLFGIQVYQDALIKYIKLTDTPITIALQGEWGSGKTSLMNQLCYNLCETEDAPFYSIWVNTWQFSLMKTPQQAIISILEAIINQIGQLNPNAHKWEESKKKIGGLFKKMATIGTKVAVGFAGIDGEIVDDVFSTSESASDISALKEETARLIEDALLHNPSKRGFNFYIDDLDRIDPPVAVEILELLKNIFDLEKCVFILAIDYDVVIKGLKPKFGELTDRNEREFRSFFDKIIQLPFSMPVASYSIDTFLVDALSKIGFFTPEQLVDSHTAEELSEIARLSVGSNPRSLKRLTNTLALISIINETQGNGADAKQHSLNSMILNFALVCMQIAYPYIYNQLTEEPDFKQWNDRIASRLKLRPLTEAEKESLDSIEEFDEEWEKVLFRMCQKETYLSTRTFNVSSLLNKIAVLAGDDANLGEIISETLELSAVTNLKAFDGPLKKEYKFNRDTNNYKYNGKVYQKKTELVYDVVNDYVISHPNITHQQLKDAFPVKKNMDGVFMDYNMYLAIKAEKGKVDFFGNKTLDDTIKLADCNILICSNWPTTSSGKPAEFSKLLDILKNKHNIIIQSV